MNQPSTLPNLAARLADLTERTPDSLYAAFTAWASDRGITLYEAQEEAVLEILTGNNVILATPTGSGKSLVAVAAHFRALADGQRSYYTAPIKALVSEKFFALVDIFGAENVGLVTGDSSLNADAPIVCCTAEILANKTLREGRDADVGMVIMDEFHFYADPQRGWAWQVPLYELPGAQFLLMSATLGDVSEFEERLTESTGRETVLVANATRPIPLHFYYVTSTINETIEEIASTGQAPVYVVHFSQADAIERAQSLLSVNLVSRERKDRIAEAIGDFRFGPGFGKTLSKLVRHGIGVHHAGMLPKYRRLVEQLAGQGLLTVISGTDTLGVGINVPIRTVLLTALSKYDGDRTRHLSAREFHQLAGRAGRAGFDTAGTVMVEAPEHVIENERAMAKARSKFGDDQKKLRQVTRKQPPAGFVSWGEPTFELLRDADPEPLRSQFKLSHSMVLNLMARGGNPIAQFRELIEKSGETRTRKFALLRQGIGILRELLATGVVERTGDDAQPGGLRLKVDLQENFALNQPLSPFAVAALELLDAEDPNHALNVVSVIESTLEPPRQVLYAQEKKAKSEAVAAMKAEGLEYNERMARLDEISYPKPLGELLEQSFETYTSSAPWLTDFELTPKSVVRDMFERAMTFTEYVSFYQLTRSEGVLLRYLSDAYKALRQTVPTQSITEELEDLIAWLGEMVHQVDSSLLDEWEDLRRGDLGALERDELDVPPPPPPLASNTRAFKVMVRNAMFARVKLFAEENEEALGELDQDSGWDADRWAEAMDEYFDEYPDIDDGPAARGPHLLHITQGETRWKVRQVFLDPQGNGDWGINAEVDVPSSNLSGVPVIRIDSVGLPLAAS